MPTTTPPTLLCVDDEAIVLLALKMELKNHYRDRFKYETAISAHEAIRIVEELKRESREVAMVITDWQMPGMKGDQLLEHVHSIDPEIRGIIITGQADMESIERAKALPNLAGILKKPWTSNQLFLAIDREP